MTSTKYFSHALSQAIRENAVLPAVGIAAFCVLIPVSTAGLPAASIFNIDYTHDQLKFRFFAESFVPAVHYFTILFGAICGIMLFKFLADKRQTAATLTLGLTRGALFMSRFFAAAVIIAASILVPMTVSLILNMAALGVDERLLPFFFYVCAGLFLQAMTAFALSAMACCLAGTVGEGMYFACVLISLPTAVFYAAGTLTRSLLHGSAFGAFMHGGVTEVQPGFTQMFSAFNPAMFFYEDLGRYSMYRAGVNTVSPQSVSLYLPFLWLVITAALAAAALALFKKRRAENAGMAGLCPAIRIIGSVAPGAVLFAAAVGALAGFSLTIALLAGSAAYLVWSLALLRSLSGAVGFQRRRLLGVLAQLAAVWAVVLALLGGGLGFSQYVPDPSRVLSVEVSYAGTPSFLSSARGSSMGSGYYIVSNYSYTDIQDVEIALSLHRGFAAQGRRAFGEAGPDFSETVLPYDVVFRYTMENGAAITRYYDRAAASLLAGMLSLDGTASVRDSRRQAITGVGGAATPYWAAGAFAFGDIYVTGSWYEAPMLLQLSEAQRAALRECIARDTDAQSVQDRYFPGSPPLYVLMFTRNAGEDIRSFRYQLQNTLVYVTEAFTETIAFLGALGIGVPETPLAEFVSLQRFEPFGVINRQPSPRSLYFQGYISRSGRDFITTADFGLPYEVRDAGRLAELMPILRNDYFMSGGGYLVAVKLHGIDDYVYKFLPYADAPEYIRQALG